MHQTRRQFMKDVASAAGALAALPAPGGAATSAGKRAQARPPIIDGLGEIHLDYPPELLDAILSTGMRGCVVTVGNPALQGATAFDDMKAEIDGYDKHIAANPERLMKVTDTAGLHRAADTGRLGLLYYTQNASPIGDDPARLGDLRQLGVCSVQLTYNTRNLLGDGCLERTNTGLSRFGIEVVAALNALRMLVDLSHCGEATTADGIAFSKAPVAITHAGCKAVFDHPRNKTDDTLRAMAQKGGVVGIYQINPYLGPNPRNTLDDYLTHVDHAIKVAGIDHVGIGSDREHRSIPDTEEEKQKLIDELSRLRPVTASTFRWPFFIAELNHPRRMRTLADALGQRGRRASEIDKILGGNFLRLFRETIG